MREATLLGEVVFPASLKTLQLQGPCKGACGAPLLVTGDVIVRVHCPYSL